MEINPKRLKKLCSEGGSNSLKILGPQGNKKRGSLVRIKVNIIENDEQISAQASQG
jgi:hypothetical protein